MKTQNNLKVAYTGNTAPDFEGLADYLLGKPMPAAPELEEAVIGACLADVKAFGLVRQILEPKHFYSEANQLIFEAMKALEEDPRAKIDMLTVMEQLKANKKLNAVGGPGYLAGLTNRVASAANLEYHSRLVYQKWVERDTIQNLCTYLRKSFDGSEDVFNLRNDISEVMRVQPPTALLKSGSFTKSAEEGKKMPKLDRICGSLWNRGEVAFFFGPPGTGKSIFAVQIADAMSKGKDVIDGYLTNECEPLKVLYLDFELTDQNMTKRYTNQFGEVYDFDDEMLIRVHINDDFLDFDEKIDKLIHQQIENLILIHKPDALIVDNITWITSENSQDASVATRIMKRLVFYKKRYGLSLLVIAHAVKAAKNKHVPLESSDMQGSSNLEIFCDAKFGIKTSAVDPNLKYIKQFKDRNEEALYEEDNVIILSINDKSNEPHQSFLGFNVKGFDRESAHIAMQEPVSKNDENDFIENCIIEMYKNNWSWSDAVKETGWIKSLNTLRTKVGKWIDEKDVTTCEWVIVKDKYHPRNGRPVKKKDLKDLIQS